MSELWRPGGGSGRKSSLNPIDYVAKGGWYPIGVYHDGRMQSQTIGGTGTVDLSVTKTLHVRQAATQIKLVWFTTNPTEGFTSTMKTRTAIASGFKARVAVQTTRLTLTGSPTGGTFRIGYMFDNTSATINHNATVAQVQAALDGLAANVSTQTGFPVTFTCTGSNLPAGPINIQINTGGEALIHNIHGFYVGANSLTGGTAPTPVFTNQPAAYTNVVFPSINGGDNTVWSNWGYNDGIVVSLPFAFTTFPGARLNVQMVWNGLERAAFGGVAAASVQIPSQNAYSNRYPVNKQYQGRFTIDAITTGNDIIAGTGTPSNLSVTHTVAPALILGNLSGLTRRLNVLVFGDSILGESQNICDMLENFGYNCIPWGHAGSSPREALDRAEFRYLASKADLIIWAATANTLNPQALDSASYFGSSTATDTSRLLDDIMALAEEIGKPFALVPPYLMGLNAANLAAQTLTKTSDTTAYNRSIDFRTRAAALMSADPRNGILLDVYGPIIVNGADQGLTLRYGYQTLAGDGTLGLELWRLDTDNVSAGAPTDNNVFAWRIEQFNTGGSHTLRGYRVDGGAAGSQPFALRHKMSQELAFGPSAPNHDAGLGTMAKGRYQSCRVHCYKGGGGTPVAVGQWRTLFAGPCMFQQGPNNTFRVATAPTAGTVYTDSWWRMEFSNNLPYPLTDNNGHASATTGLHLDGAVVSACWWRALQYQLHPLLQQIQREA